MSGYYWIKFYVEVLDDSKVATLPDRLWRRFFELCLIAGAEGKNGRLPNSTQIAWRLRLHTDDLILDLKQLELAELIYREQDDWVVKNFSKRQAPVPSAERVKQYRERERHIQYAGEENINAVTGMKRSVTQNRIDKNREEKNRGEECGVFTFFDAERLYIKVTNQPGIPSTARDKLELILSALQRWGEEETEKRMNYQWGIWTKRRTKDGKPYSQINAAWIDQILIEDDLMPAVMTAEERAREELKSMRLKQ